MAGIDKHLLCAKILGYSRSYSALFHLPWVFNLRRETFWDALTEMTVTGGWEAEAREVHQWTVGDETNRRPPAFLNTLKPWMDFKQLSGKNSCPQIPQHPAYTRTFWPVSHTRHRSIKYSSLQMTPLSQNFLELSLIYLFPAPPLPRDNVNPFKATYIFLPQTHCITEPWRPQDDGHVCLLHPARLLV